MAFIRGALFRWLRPEIEKLIEERISRVLQAQRASLRRR